MIIVFLTMMPYQRQQLHIVDAELSIQPRLVKRRRLRRTPSIVAGRLHFDDPRHYAVRGIEPIDARPRGRIANGRDGIAHKELGAIVLSLAADCQKESPGIASLAGV